MLSKAAQSCIASIQQETAMKTVMVLIHDDNGQESRLQCALDVTRALEGHLVCLDVVRLPIMADGFGMGDPTGALIMDERDREDDNVARLEPRLANEGVSFEWSRIHSNSDLAIVDCARLVDLIVVGKQGVGELGDSGDLAARLAEQTSAPILLVPAGQMAINLSGKAMVSWDGSAAADAAIRAAVPLLKLADQVDVVTIGTSENDADPQQAAAYLARHGCKVNASSIARNGDVADQLLGLMVSTEPDWCVMGSYGHSRLREQIFGGTTKTLLAHAPVPLLVSH
jgi:nucleotide-binding universal stress UspA family protein